MQIIDEMRVFWLFIISTNLMNQCYIKDIFEALRGSLLRVNILLCNFCMIDRYFVQLKAFLQSYRISSSSNPQSTSRQVIHGSRGQEENLACIPRSFRAHKDLGTRLEENHRHLLKTQLRRYRQKICARIPLILLSTTNTIYFQHLADRQPQIINK